MFSWKNLDLLKFLKIINYAKGLEIGSRHITVSTSGLAPKITEFASFPLQINLAISLHFASDEKRCKYMPINKAYNLKSLFDALDIYYKITNRRITFEYIMIDGINDTISDAFSSFAAKPSQNKALRLTALRPYITVCLPLTI